jgi:integrase
MPAARLKPASRLLSGETAPAALVDSVLRSLQSPDTVRSYRTGIDALYAFKGPRLLTPDLLYEWREAMRQASTSGTVNARFAAVRKLFVQATHAGVLTDAEAAPLLRVQGLPYLGSRVGNWLTPAQAQALLRVPDRKRLLGCRNFCILAVLLGCALRVSELAALDVRSIQQRDGRWVLADILKKRHMRTVAIPGWTKLAIDAWLKRSGVTSGRLIDITPQAILHVVRNAASRIGIAGIGPHDLRRTCARAMWTKQVPLEQIQLMLGHQSMRYLGSLQNLAHAPNDDLGFS